MVLDANLQLLDGALSQTAGTTVNGGALELGRRGLTFGAQLIVILDNPAGPASGALAVELQLSIDNGSTHRTIATIDLGVLTDDFQGQRVQEIGVDFAAQEYADANIQLRERLVGTGGSGTLTADKLAVFVGSGEAQKWGRKKTGDTLFV